ncbi:hypothetical protein I7I48_03050 [Histoplasma ohiense]|nr:hypothetical protein I7I48_03050 [Histoplasma ohiense (nom. inval.)]
MLASIEQEMDGTEVHLLRKYKVDSNSFFLYISLIAPLVMFSLDCRRRPLFPLDTESTVVEEFKGESPHSRPPCPRHPIERSDDSREKG